MAGTNWVCKELGQCQPCPKDELSTPVCSFYGHRRQLSCTPLHPTSNPYTPQSKTSRPSSHDEDNDDEQPLAPPAPIPTARIGSLPGTFHTNQEEADEENAFSSDPGSGAGAVVGANADSAPWRAAPQGEGDQLDAGVDEAILDAEEAWGEEGVELAEERGRERWRRQGRLDGEVRTWEACGKVVSVERKDFGEFVMCNLFFAAVSVATLSYRYRHLASRQYGTLVARLGMSVSQN